MLILIWIHACSVRYYLNCMYFILYIWNISKQTIEINMKYEIQFMLFILCISSILKELFIFLIILYSIIILSVIFPNRWYKDCMWWTQGNSRKELVNVWEILWEQSVYRWWGHPLGWESTKMRQLTWKAPAGEQEGSTEFCHKSSN